MEEHPLFIPLNAEHFEAFEAGEKAEEYRAPGGRWNARTCRPGRPVVLSYGYGKQRRLRARVRHFRHVKVSELPLKAREAVRAIYGQIDRVVVIGLDVEPLPKD